MNWYNDEHPDLKPGNTKIITLDDHVFHVTATKLDGFHTGRCRYMVECTTCKMLVHPASTSADAQINRHVADAKRGQAKPWPPRLDPP